MGESAEGSPSGSVFEGVGSEMKARREVFAVTVFFAAGVCFDMIEFSESEKEKEGGGSPLL